MSALPDLLLVTAIPASLKAELATRFQLHREPSPQIRAIVGGGMSRVDAALIEQLPALEIISIFGVGHDGIDLAAARARGIAVTITPDVLTDDVADLAIGLMLAVQRNIVANDRAVRDGGWAVPLACQASGRRIGIFGMGAIGRAIAHRAAPFAAEVCYTSRSAKLDLPYRFVPTLAALAEQVEVLIVAASAGPGSNNAVDAAVLTALGPNGVLINIARGSIVDEAALIDALDQRRIAGAGLDVFAHEPSVPDALKALDTVVLQSHQGSATVEGRAAMAELVLANLDAQFAGRALPSAIT